MGRLTVLEYAPSDLMNVAYLNPFIYIYYYRGTVSWSTVNMTCIDLCTNQYIIDLHSVGFI